MAKPILYFDLGKMFQLEGPPSADETFCTGWGDSWKGQGVMIGNLEVGQVVDFSTDVRDGHAHCGLVIEWSNQLESVADYQGGTDGG